jgi:hypothetical protein
MTRKRQTQRTNDRAYAIPFRYRDPAKGIDVIADTLVTRVTPEAKPATPEPKPKSETREYVNLSAITRAVEASGKETTPKLLRPRVVRVPEPPQSAPVIPETRDHFANEAPKEGCSCRLCNAARS